MDKTKNIIGDKLVSGEIRNYFIASALLVALFFTACEQEVILEPIEDNTVLLENDVQLPQEAVDALEVLITSGPGGGTNCSLLIKPRGYKTSGNNAWFYFHVDRKDTPSSNYKLVSSGGIWTNDITWNPPTFPGVTLPNGNEYCAFRTYVYVWDGPCNIWRRLSVKYSTHGG